MHRQDRHTILVVEDSADVRLLISMALRTNGFDVAQAEDGASALQYLQRNAPPSLIILDVRMPGMDGFQFRAEQARHPGISDIPILVYTAEPDLKRLAQSLPAAAYISKSSSLSTMVAEIRRFCS